MKKELYGELGIIPMSGCEDFASQVDRYLKTWRNTDESFLIQVDCPRFGSGEGKGVVNRSVRGTDLYVLCDMFNYGVTYKHRGVSVPMTPDEHYADLKRILGAIDGKARRISVIMPMLYEGRQHKRTNRESLDCAMMLRELEFYGVKNVITFDAHDPRVANAIPLIGFDNYRPSYQMVKALVREVPDVAFDKEQLVIIAPDEGAMERGTYFASILGVDMGMFYKRRDYSTIVNGRNPIIAHEYLGRHLDGKDAIIVDDMISSGDSFFDVARQVKQRGARRIFSFSTFGLFTAGLEGFDKAYAEGVFDKVFTTNLIYEDPELESRPWHRSVNMCKYVSYIIETNNRDESTGTILDPAKKIHALLDRHRADAPDQMAIDFDDKK